jgi:glycosyltransferase involved in cell wall biosynthesis
MRCVDPMKSKFFTPYDSREGGMTEYSRSIHDSLNKSGRCIEIVTNNNFSTSNPFYFIRKALKCRKCDSLLVQFNASLFGKLFKFNGVYLGLFYFLLLFRGPKIVSIIHDIPDLSKMSFYKRFFLKSLYLPILLFSNKITVHNPDARKLILEYGCPKRKIELVEHGINTTDIKIQNKQKAKKKIGFENKKILLSWGYIRASKNNEEIIKVMPKLPKNIIFIVVGPSWILDQKNAVSADKKYCEYLYDLVKQKNLQSRVIIDIRRLNDQEISDYMSAADISVLPYKFSTQSGVLSKSWAYKKTVLASDVPPFSYLKNQYGGLETFQLGNEQDLINKIKSLLYDKKKISNLNKNVESICKKRNWNVISLEFWNILEKFIKNKGEMI